MKRKTFSKGRKESRKKFQARKLEGLKARIPEEVRTLSFAEFVKRCNNFSLLFRDSGTVERKNLLKEIEALKRVNPKLFKELSRAVTNFDAISSGQTWFFLLEKLKRPYKSFRKDWPKIRMKRITDFRIDQRFKRDQIKLAEDRIKFNKFLLTSRGAEKARLEEEIAAKSSEIESLQEEITHIDRQIAAFEQTSFPGKSSAEFERYLKGLKIEKSIYSSKHMQKSVQEGSILYSLLYKAYKAFRRFNPSLKNSQLFV